MASLPLSTKIHGFRDDFWAIYHTTSLGVNAEQKPQKHHKQIHRNHLQQITSG